MRELIESNMSTFLERAGARPPRNGRGKWTCPDCQRPALSVNLDEQVFHCFHSGCGFRGGIGTLRERLGMMRNRLPLAEYWELQQKHKRAREASMRLYAAAHSRQLKQREDLRLLGRMEQTANEAGPDNPNTWAILALVYVERPRIEQELDALESGNPSAVLEALRS